MQSGNSSSLFWDKILSWLWLSLVYHTDTCSYSALCCTLDFLIMGIEGIAMIKVKIDQNWALLSRLLTAPLMFTLNSCPLELCSFYIAIIFNTLCKSYCPFLRELKSMSCTCTFRKQFSWYEISLLFILNFRIICISLTLVIWMEKGE